MKCLLPLLLCAPLLDFSGDPPGGEPSGLLVVDGVFTVVGDGENRVLEVQAEPITESVALFGPRLEPGKTVVSARVKAEKKRRVAPRFGIGMHGTAGYRLRAVPAARQLELLKDKHVVATVPVAWEAGKWATLELALLPDGDAWVVEGRIWPDGGERPAEPTLRHPGEAPGKGKASVWATPYAGLPIWIDDLAVENAGA